MTDKATTTQTTTTTTTPKEVPRIMHYPGFPHDIAEMNAMYGLAPVNFIGTAEIRERLAGFKKTMLDELDEVDAIITKLNTIERGLHTLDGFNEVSDIADMFADMYADIFDWFADLTVYTQSETHKFASGIEEAGTPDSNTPVNFDPSRILSNSMAANFTKKWPDPVTGAKYSVVKYDEAGKFIKGPDTIKPDEANKAYMLEIVRSMFGLNRQSEPNTDSTSSSSDSLSSNE